MEYENRWEVLSTWYEGNRKYVSAKCRICDEVAERSRSASISGSGQQKKECSCTRKVRGKPIAIGTRFGRLVVLGRSLESPIKDHVFMEVKCDCGVIKTLQAVQLRSGSTNSCGCLLDELIGRTPEKHGMSKTKEHITWCGVVSRTQNAFESTREWYFDKGISMSSEWRQSFTKFYEDMGPCPEGYTIDRIDPSGNYCKENCRWASIELQSINKGIFKNNTSGSTGVSQTKRGSYISYIYHNYGRIHLGTFENIEDAINARKQAEETYWGDINE